MGKHAKYSPSSGHRYMNCPPALLLEEQFPDIKAGFYLSRFRQDENFLM